MPITLQKEKYYNLFKIVNMLRTIRLILAAVCFALITLLFLDFTGTLHTWFGWLAKIQFLPALLALNIGVIFSLIVITLLLGRIYCSVICPLGVLQDVIAWFGKRRKKLPYHYTPAHPWLRNSVMAAFVFSAVAGFSVLVELLAPYSNYGRIVSNLFAPVYQWANNGLAYLAERTDSYAFYAVDIRIQSGITLSVVIITFVALFVLAWRNGRTYCNTICPVGTVLGFISRFSIFRPVIDTSKCNGCGLCARHCKASCIDVKEHRIDNSRCVVCMNCITKCKKGAIRYVRNHSIKTIQVEKQTVSQEQIDHVRRVFLASAALLTTTSALKAQEKKVDGGIAIIEDKKIPKRGTALTPPGSLNARNFKEHCTACQLCISVCPTHVLRPCSKLDRFMQPEISYERGYCRPECTKCSEVCPTGAIHSLNVADKSSVQIGHAVWIKKNCIVMTDNEQCDNCAQHCPTRAIEMVDSPLDETDGKKIPAINIERCIGCGACEHLCPARPFSAIYVEGHEAHRII